MNLKEAQDLLLQEYSCRYDEKDLNKLFKLFDIEGVNKTYNKFIIGISKYYHLDRNKLWGSNKPFYRKVFNLSEVNIEFVLPENWHVVVTEENKEDILKWYNCSAQIGNIVGMVKWDTGDIHKGWNRSNIKSESYDYGVEITYDQFLKYVLKQENMKTEKKLMGYKLIKPEYKNTVLSLLSYHTYTFVPRILLFDFNLVKNSTYIENLKTAGVLSLWFEEVYEEQIISYSEGDYLYCKENFYMNIDERNPRFIKDKIYKATSANSLPKEIGNPRHIMGVKSDYENNKTFNDYFRFATEEEIKEYNKKKDVVLILGSRKIRIVISKGKITADDKDWNIRVLESMYLTMTDITLQGYSIKYPNIVIGCSTFSSEEIKQIIDTYESFEC